ncbi:unnamed protein product, partial [Closterium sp. NIES-54]
LEYSAQKVLHLCHFPQLFPLPSSLPILSPPHFSLPASGLEYSAQKVVHLSQFLYPVLLPLLTPLPSSPPSIPPLLPPPPPPLIRLGVQHTEGDASASILMPLCLPLLTFTPLLSSPLLSSSLFRFSSHQAWSLEYSAQKVVHLRQFLKTTNSETLVFVVGAMASGDISSDYVDEMIAVSEYPLSAATCLSRLCTTLELKWGIL